MIIPPEDACRPCPIRIAALARFADEEALWVVARGAQSAAIGLYREKWIERSRVDARGQ
ncbi:MAG: hypothetical protein AAGI52_13105 [Bacteroidota bacterium]